MGLLGLLFGPRLYYKFVGLERDVNIVESISDNVFSTGRGIHAFLSGFGPLVIGYMYSKSMFTTAYAAFFMRIVVIYATIAYSTRLLGRILDTEYRIFLDVLDKAKETRKLEDIQELKKYDFEISGAPVDFVAKINEKLWYHTPSKEELNANPITKESFILSYVCVHSFGRRMLYPGSVSLLNWLLGKTIQENRKLLINTKSGQRVWLQTTENDIIDALYIDGRKENADRGRTLVICCEGNAGFYEIGIANTPAQLGYSVLGWNTPGFAESTGVPMPKNVYAAADALMQYAMGPLGYDQSNIVLFGWSIGGFPASWLAANYPQVRALVLDATFDDVLPLAISRMPKFAENIVTYAIRNYLNLQIDKQIAKYQGPVRLIRRLQEEIILTDEFGTDEERRASNRANVLLKVLLDQRHAEIVRGLEPQVDRWLAMSPEQRIVAGSAVQSLNEQRVSRLFNLCDHYLVDFDATHVTPLSPLFFNIPPPMLGR